MDLANELNAILAKWALVIVGDIQREWGNHPIEGEAEINHIMGLLVNEISATFIAQGQKAWILEYGKGSMMDSDNPYLGEYKSNPNWNRYRKGNAITGRGEGEYQDLDGNTHYSSGKAIGRNLEAIGKEEYFPSGPLHIIRESIHEHMLLIQEDIMSTVALFSVDLFLSNFPKEITI